MPTGSEVLFLSCLNPIPPLTVNDFAVPEEGSIFVDDVNTSTEPNTISNWKKAVECIEMRRVGESFN